MTVKNAVNDNSDFPSSDAVSALSSNHPIERQATSVNPALPPRGARGRFIPRPGPHAVPRPARAHKNNPVPFPLSDSRGRTTRIDSIPESPQDRANVLELLVWEMALMEKNDRFLMFLLTNLWEQPELPPKQNYELVILPTNPIPNQDPITSNDRSDLTKTNPS